MKCDVDAAANSITYGEGGRYSGAFYRPSSEGPFPAVLVLHTRGGFNAHVRSAAAFLASQGFVTLAPDYFTPLGVRVPASDLQVLSVLNSDGAREVMAGAVECLKTLSSVDPQRLGAVGFSLGGYFAFVLATRNDLKAVVSFYGAYHGTPVSAIPTRYSWPAIVTQMRTPALILHGDADTTIPLSRANRVRRMMEEGSKRVEMVVYPGAEHAFDQTGAPTFNVSAAADAQARMLAFLNSTLR